MPLALDVQNLSYTYPGEKDPVLRNVSFSVEKGDVIGIIGPSGCGKSTLMLTLAGLIPHSLHGSMKGTVKALGKDTRGRGIEELSQVVQIVFQNPESQIFALNVEDEVTFGPENLALPWEEIEERRSDALEAMSIENLRQQSIEELSSGQKQKVAIAAILSMKPKILLFDEPTANLDEPSIRRIEEVISRLGKRHTIIVVEHNVDFLKRITDRILLMNRGRVVAEGKPSAVIKSKHYKRVLLPPTDMEKARRRLRNSGVEKGKEALLEIRDLNFSYSNKKGVLRNVSLDIGKGDFLGIVGLNGSGKSTLALNIVGLLRERGKILLDGRDITRTDVADKTEKIGYVFQNPDYQLFEETVAREISFGPKNIRLSRKKVSKRVEETLKATDMHEFKGKDPHALSVGQKRRVSIASVLAMEPEILIIDEPDTGVDNKTARQFMNHIKDLNRKGKTIIIISHNLGLLADYCNRIVAMKQGRIVEPEEVFKDYFTK